MVHRTVLLGLFLVSFGCTEDSATTPGEGMSSDTAGTMVEDLGVPESELTPDGDVISLTPENTKIGFVGTHVVDAKPDPNARVGSFQKFSGTATVADGTLVALQVDIETDSITTTEDKLTAHLKNADFFDVLEYPKASFRSTSITQAEEGRVSVTGDLTLLKETKSITFPATVTTDGGLKLDAEFTIDRTEFGMSFGEGKVENEVQMTISVSA